MNLWVKMKVFLLCREVASRKRNESGCFYLKITKETLAYRRLQNNWNYSSHSLFNLSGVKRAPSNAHRAKAVGVTTVDFKWPKVEPDDIEWKRKSIKAIAVHALLQVATLYALSPVEIIAVFRDFLMTSKSSSCGNSFKEADASIRNRRDFHRKYCKTTFLNINLSGS